MRAQSICLVLLLGLLIEPASASEIAPIPDGYHATGEKMQRGLYAEASFGRIDVNTELDEFEAQCKAKNLVPAVNGKELQWKGLRRLYRTVNTVAVIEETPKLETDPISCTARISLVRSVSVRTGKWKNIKPYDFEKLPKCDWLRRCSKERLAGVEALCYDQGDGLNGTYLCLSSQKGMSYGLVLSRTNYCDDDSCPGNTSSFDKVLTDALIDPAVFKQES